MITIWVPKRLVEVGLYNVAARSPQELAALSEQSYRAICAHADRHRNTQTDHL